ncbi:MAG: hypothetical protein PHX83_13465 [Acidobacteriia bacterium]|nr:hypothetical protein [Terriglobia bacterium]
MPSPARRYVMKNATSAIIIERVPLMGRIARKIITVPSESVIDVRSPLNDAEGLIEVNFEGETVLMFAEDLQGRGEPMPKPAV